MAQRKPARLISTSKTNFYTEKSGRGRRLITALLSSIRKGEVETENEIMPTVAMKTGELRKAVRRALKKEKVRIVVSKNKISIRFQRNQLTKGNIKEEDKSEEQYMGYHIHPGSRYGSSYIKPTTENTEPLDTRKYNRTLIKNVKSNLPGEFKKQFG